MRQVGPVAAVLANLEMSPYRLRFTGTAGSGKSLVARHVFARLAGEGKRVLLTCFNRPLAERLEREERLLYCGMTRATVRLDLVVQQDNPANRRFLEP